MESKLFKFKQFTINQDQCAMKIGTDSALLGSWTSIANNPNSILDIGSGTGILALMLAQRSSAQAIEAIEIDDNAFIQCVENFENSSWSDRLFCYHASLQEFTNEIEDNYDLIISNPPFHKPNLALPSLSKGENLIPNSRKTARFYDVMPFEQLIDCTSKLLSKDGIFSVIIPFQEEQKIVGLASNSNLFANRVLHVRGNPNSNFVRSIIEFSFIESKTIFEEIIIETSRHQYTPEYIDLTKDFYLKM